MTTTAILAPARRLAYALVLASAILFACWQPQVASAATRPAATRSTSVTTVEAGWRVTRTHRDATSARGVHTVSDTERMCKLDAAGHAVRTACTSRTVSDSTTVAGVHTHRMCNVNSEGSRYCESTTDRP